MQRILSSYTINFFCNNNDIDASPASISAIMQKLFHLSLIPSIGNEFNPLTSDKRTFLRMVTPDEKAQVNFMLNSINIQFMPSDDEYNEVIKFIESVFNSLSGLYPGKAANRLSFIKSKIFSTTTEESDLIHNKLFTSLDATAPIEWERRSVHTNNYSIGNVNEIGIVKRISAAIPFHNNGREFNSICFDIDCNTSQHDTNYRFPLNDCMSTYSVLIERCKDKESYFSSNIFNL